MASGASSLGAPGKECESSRLPELFVLGAKSTNSSARLTSCLDHTQLESTLFSLDDGSNVLYLKLS